MCKQTFIQEWNKQHHALQAEKYRITAQDPLKQMPTINYGNLGAKRRQEQGLDERFWSAEEIAMQYDKIQSLNQKGYNIYITPFHDTIGYLLIDDLNEERLTKFTSEGFAPAVVLSSSEHSYQAILLFEKDLATCKSAEDRQLDPHHTGNRMFKELNQRFGDPNINAIVHPFRLVGFQNQKPTRNQYVATIHKAEHCFCPVLERIYVQARIKDHKELMKLVLAKQSSFQVVEWLDHFVLHSQCDPNYQVNPFESMKRYIARFSEDLMTQDRAIRPYETFFYRLTTQDIQQRNRLTIQHLIETGYTDEEIRCAIKQQKEPDQTIIQDWVGHYDHQLIMHLRIHSNKTSHTTEQPTHQPTHQPTTPTKSWSEEEAILFFQQMNEELSTKDISDQSRMDYMIIKTMVNQGCPESWIEEAICFGSPRLIQRHRNWRQYIQTSIQQAKRDCEREQDINTLPTIDPPKAKPSASKTKTKKSFAFVDHPTMTTNELFLPRKKEKTGTIRKNNLVKKQLGEFEIEYRCMEYLDVTDLSVFLAICKIAGENKVFIDPESESIIRQLQEKNMELTGHLIQNLMIQTKATYTQILAESNVTKTGESFERLDSILKRLTSVTCFVNKMKNGKIEEWSTTKLIHVSKRDQYGFVTITLNPMLTNAIHRERRDVNPIEKKDVSDVLTIFESGRYIANDQEEFHALKKEFSKLLHARLSAEINRKEIKKYDIDTIVHKFFPPTEQKSTMSMRRSIIKDALEEIASLEKWNISFQRVSESGVSKKQKEQAIIQRF